MNRIIWIEKPFILLTILLFAFLTSCDVLTPKTEEATSPPVIPPVVSDLRVVAEGVVLPAKSAELSFAENGIIEEVLVTQGEPVQSGQVIAKLKGLEEMLVDIVSAQTELITKQQDLEDIYENYEIDLAQVKLEKLEAERNLESSINGKVDKQQGRGDWNDLVRAQANYGMAQAKIDAVERKYHWSAEAPPSDPDRAEVVVELTSAIQERTQALGEINYYLLGPDPVEVAKSDADIGYYTAELEKKEADWLELLEGPDSDKIALAEAKLTSAQMKLESLQNDLKDIELIAPFDGTIVVSDLKEGEMVQSGTVLVNMADLSQWRVETTDLTELDIVGINVGGKVRVAFDALPDLEIPGIVGEIKEIGVNQQGDITYTAKIDLLEQSDQLKWNLTATVIFD